LSQLRFAQVSFDVGGGLVDASTAPGPAQALLNSGEPTDYIRLDDHRVIGLHTFSGMHPVITITGEPQAPAASIVHFGRVLHRI
jgi:hypothetical protein